MSWFLFYVYAYSWLLCSSLFSLSRLSDVGSVHRVAGGEPVRLKSAGTMADMCSALGAVECGALSVVCLCYVSTYGGLAQLLGGYKGASVSVI